MDAFTTLVEDGQRLLAHALAHNIALPDGVATTLGGADTVTLAGSAADKAAFLKAFAVASAAIGMSASDIRAAHARSGRLQLLVDAALSLLTFAAANGRAVEDGTRNSIVATGNAVSAGTVTVAQEQEFLKSYEELTKALAPITFETLEASTTRLPTISDFLALMRRDRSAAPPTWTLGRFVNAGIFILVLAGTGITLAYYSVGSSALSKYKDLQASATTLKQKESELERDVAAKQAALVQFQNAATAGGAPNKSEEAALSRAVMQSKADWAAVTDQRVAVREELDAIPERLGRWAMQPCVSKNVLFKAALCADVDVPDPAGANARMAAAAAARAASAPAGIEVSRETIMAANAPTVRGTLVDVEAARTVVSRMSEVYLPLLLGFLGAHAYILRRMSREVTEKIFAKGSAFNHIVRTGLGALAGLASTWLLTPDAVGGASLKALPLWALAFVAGYGIELVFAFMDRIIAAFTSPTK